MVVFAPQNVITDPPFTKLDLLSCRNLLIYLDNPLQRRLLPLFHYSLKPGGLLFLGTSESTGTFTELFRPIDTKWKLFERAQIGEHQLPRFPFTAHADVWPRVHGIPTHKPAAPPVAKLVEKMLLSQHVPPSVVVSDRGTIVHIHGRTGRFFEPATGRPSLNVLDMAREGLQPALAACLRQATKGDTEVRREGVRVKTNGDYAFVDVRARRLLEPEPLRGLILITLEERLHAELEQERESPSKVLSAGELSQIETLEQDLRYTKETLQSTIEQLETSNEELKSTNEELQSTNEELQSTNEELETSKEEMQSLNEELHTVNSELEGKLIDLSQANDDMTNLLNSTEIATVFLDGKLRIKRFTESATRVIKLIHGDVGRPIGDLASELHYESLVDDAREVVRTLAHKERTLQSRGGDWFLMRMVPYRTTDNVIDGLVMTFVDISEQKRAFAALEAAQAEVQRSEQTFRRVLESCPVPVAVARTDRELRYTWVCNPLPGFDVATMMGKRDDELLTCDGAKQLLALKRRVLETGAAERQDIAFDLAKKSQTYRVSAEPLCDAEGQMTGVSTVAIDLGQMAAAKLERS